SSGPISSSLLGSSLGSGFFLSRLFGFGFGSLLLRKGGGARLVRFRLLASSFRGSLFRFLLHAQSFGLSGFGLLASLFGFEAALRFGGSISASPRFALFRSSLVRSNFCLGVFFRLLLYGHDAGFFCCLDDFARGSFNEFAVALARVHLLCVCELLLGLCERGTSVLVGERNVRDAHGVARFKKLERRFAVDSEDSVFDLRVGRGINSASQQLVTCCDIFNLGHRSIDDVFEDHRIAGLVDGEIWFRCDDHAEGLHVGGGLHRAGPVFYYYSSQIVRSAFGKTRPQNGGEIFGANLGGFAQPEEFCVDFTTVAFFLYFAFPFGPRHELRALKVNF